MLYIARMIHKINGEIIRYFGTKQECEKHMECIGWDYVCEIRQARVIEIRAQIEIIKNRRKNIEFNCLYASQTKRDQYHKSLKRIEKEMNRLNEGIAKLQTKNNNKTSKASSLDKSKSVGGVNLDARGIDEPEKGWAA